MALRIDDQFTIDRVYVELDGAVLVRGSSAHDEDAIFKTELTDQLNAPNIDLNPIVVLVFENALLATLKLGFVVFCCDGAIGGRVLHYGPGQVDLPPATTFQQILDRRKIDRCFK